MPSTTRCRHVAMVLAVGFAAAVPAATPAAAQSLAPAPGTSGGRQAVAPPDRVAGPAIGADRGVIVPKGAVDPGMKVAAPPASMQRMPVIRPPVAGNGSRDVIVPR